MFIIHNFRPIANFFVKKIKKLLDRAKASVYTVHMVRKTSDTTWRYKMNALTKASKQSIRQTTVENYVLAIVCGLTLGVMFGLGV